jgi:CheY-specific phosphatase CheX
VVTEVEIREIAESIWGAMLGLPIEAGSVGASESWVTGCVTIGGGWSGAVTVELSSGLARQVASALFAMEPAEVTDAEVRDAVGELANMVGGNIKALMPGSCQLSLPAVANGRSEELAAARGRLFAHAELMSGMEPARVCVFEAA